MSKLICGAKYFADIYGALLMSVSSSCQAALTPWLSTLGTKEYVSLVHGALKIVALSPTFQFTRDLYCAADKELLKCDLFVPLYSHLQSLHLQVEGEFNFGVDVANLVLRFKRLQKFELSIDIFSADPNSVIHVIETLLARKTHFSNNFVVNFVNTSLQFWLNQLADAIGNEHPQTYLPKYPIITLLKDKNITLLLQDRMFDLYKQDHGESLIVFFNSFKMLATIIIADSDYDAMSPTLDLIEQIVMNGDLLHRCYCSKHAEPILDHSKPNSLEQIESSKRWSFACTVCNLLSSFVRSCFRSHVIDLVVDFMNRYGRCLFPEIVSFFMKSYDHSFSAIIALDDICGAFTTVVYDSDWFDELNSSPTIEDIIEKMIKKGRGLLAHMPFNEIAFMLEESCKHLPDPGFTGGFRVGACLEKVAQYMREIERLFFYRNPLRYLERIDFIEDLVERFNKQNLTTHFFDCLEKNLETTIDASDRENSDLRTQHRQDLEIFNELTSSSTDISPLPSEGVHLDYSTTHRFVDGNRKSFFKTDSIENGYPTIRRILEYAKKAMSDVETTKDMYSELMLETPEKEWNDERLLRAQNLGSVTEENQLFLAAIQRLLWVAIRHLHEQCYGISPANLKERGTEVTIPDAKRRLLLAELFKHSRRANIIEAELKEVEEVCQSVQDEIKKKLANKKEKEIEDKLE